MTMIIESPLIPHFWALLLLLGATSNCRGAKVAPNPVVEPLTALLRPGMSEESDITLVFGDQVGEGQTELTEKIKAIPNSASLYTVGHLAWAQSLLSETERCPFVIERPNMTEEEREGMIPEGQLYKRRQLIPLGVRPLTVVIWASEGEGRLGEALGVMEDTVMWCKQKFDMGAFHLNTRFLVVTSSRNETDSVFESEPMSKHPYVAAMEVQPDGRSLFWSYNFYHQTDGQPRLVFQGMWGGGGGGRRFKLESLFTRQRTFGGRNFKLVNLPYAHYVQATFVSDEEGGLPTQRYVDQWGFLVDFVDALREELNFTVTWLNPENLLDWGDLDAEGEWTGSMRMVYDGTVDFKPEISCDYIKNQVLDNVYLNYREYMTFASPPSTVRANLTAVVTAFDPFVLTAALLSVFLAGAALYEVVRREAGPGSQSQVRIRPWDQLGESVWYCFGTLLGESITRDSKVHRVVAARWAIGSWMLYCVLIGASYSSNLKSHLTTPLATGAVSTLKELIEQPEMDIVFPIYFSSEESYIASSEQPTLKKLWERKVPIYEYYTPLDDVSRGEAARIDWISSLEARIKSEHSTSDGEAFVHLGGEPILAATYQSMGFHPHSPWMHRLGQFISRVCDSGLIYYWEEKAWRRMRLMKSNFVEIDSECQVCPLRLEHYYGTLMLIGTVFVCGVASFAAEMTVCYKAKGDTVKKEEEEEEEEEKEENPGDESPFVDRKRRLRKMVVRQLMD